MTRRKVLGTAAAAGVFAPSLVSAAPSTLRFGSFVGPTSFLNVGIFEPWFQQMQQASQDSLNVQFLTGGSTAKPNEVIDAVTAGIIDIGWSITAYNPGRFNASGVAELPVVTANAEEGGAGMSALYEAGLLDGFDDVKVLGVATADVGRLHHARDVTGLDDFAGGKIRAAGRVLSSMLEKIGATPVGMPITSVAESLAKNVIDGAAADWLSLDAFRLIDVTRTHVNLALGAPAMYLVMNKQSYEGLPDDQKAIIDSMTPRDFANFWSERLQAESNRVHDLVAGLSDHTIISEPSAEDTNRWNSAADEVISEWKASMENGDEILEVYQAAVEAFRS